MASPGAVGPCPQWERPQHVPVPQSLGEAASASAALTQLNPAQQHEMETQHPECQLRSKGRVGFRSLGVSFGPLSCSSSCPAAGPRCSPPEQQQPGAQADHGDEPRVSACCCRCRYPLCPLVGSHGAPRNILPVSSYHILFSPRPCAHPELRQPHPSPPTVEVHQEEGLGTGSSRTGPPKLLCPGHSPAFVQPCPSPRQPHFPDPESTREPLPQPLPRGSTIPMHRPSA